MRSWLNGYGAGANKEGKDYSSNNFLTNAFTAGERSAIQSTSIVNDDNFYFDTEGGNDTSDQVYLLSLDEVMNPVYGFSSDYNKYDKCRKAVNTAYVAGGGEIEAVGTEDAGGNNAWWLRTPGYASGSAVIVDYFGDVYRHGYYAAEVSSYHGSEYRAGSVLAIEGVAVRPALHLNLKAMSDTVVSDDTLSNPIWSYAGTITSEEGEKDVAPTQPTEPSSKPDVKPSAAPGTAPTISPRYMPSVITPRTQLSAASDAISIGNVSAVKLKQKKQSVAVSWKKVSGAAGYQVCYSTSKKWKNKKQKLSRKNTLTVKKPKKNKTYYFRIRAYHMNGTKKVYGAWSKTKKIMVKKYDKHH